MSGPDPTVELDGNTVTGRPDLTQHGPRGYECESCGAVGSTPTHLVICHRFYPAQIWGSPGAITAREVLGNYDTEFAQRDTDWPTHCGALSQALRLVLAEIDTAAGAE